MKKHLYKGFSLVLILSLLISIFPMNTIAEVDGYPGYESYEKEIYNFIQNDLNPNHFTDLYVKNATKSQVNELQALADEIVKDAKTNSDKIRLVCDWMKENITYRRVPSLEEPVSMDVLSAWDTYKERVGKCGGYANLSGVLLRMVGVPSLGLVDSYSNPGHGFNASYDGERWVIFDPTWHSSDPMFNYLDISIDELLEMDYHRITNIEGACVDGVLYDLTFLSAGDKTKFAYSYTDKGDEEEITIRGEIYDMPVRLFGGMYRGNSVLEKVTISSGITEIGNGMFKDCTKLKSITLPDTLITMGTDIFSGCSSLKTLVIPDSVTSCAHGLVTYSGIESLTIGGGLKVAPSLAGAEKLKKVVLKEGVEEILPTGFSGCVSLEELHLPSSLKKIGSAAFYSTTREIDKIYYNGSIDDWRKVSVDVLNSAIPTKNFIFLKEATPTPTPSPTPTMAPTPTPTVKPIQTPTPSEEPTIRPTSTPEPTVAPTVRPTPTAKPTPTPYSDILKNHKKRENYDPTVFKDVTPDDWFYTSAKTSYEFAIIRGKGNSTFAPRDNITIGEAIKIAAVIHNIYNGGNGDVDFKKVPNQMWYQRFVDYSLEKFLFGLETTNYDKNATRAEMAYIFSLCVPDEEFTKIREIDSVPDMTANHPYYERVIKLYSAGILSGNDRYGTFTPDAPIVRAEAVAIISRLIDRSQRNSNAIQKR